jgi:hypothetical protein
METKKSHSNKTKTFLCESCHYKCSKNNEYIKHLLTPKHIRNACGNIKISVDPYTCKNCNKVYKSRKGLWSHKKICSFSLLQESFTENEIKTETETENENIVIDSSNNHIVELLIKENSDFKNIIMELVKSNTDLQKQMVDVCKNIQPTTINNNNNNNY